MFKYQDREYIRIISNHFVPSHPKSLHCSNMLQCQQCTKFSNGLYDHFNLDRLIKIQSPGSPGKAWNVLKQGSLCSDEAVQAKSMEISHAEKNMVTYGNICNFCMCCVEIPNLAVFAEKYIGHFETNDIHGEATVAQSTCKWLEIGGYYNNFFKQV